MGSGGVPLFALGMAGLGIVALIYGDFAMVWQPVAAWVPARTALAYGSGVLMLLCGTALLFPPTVTWPVRILFPYLVCLGALEGAGRWSLRGGLRASGLV